MKLTKKQLRSLINEAIGGQTVDPASLPYDEAMGEVDKVLNALHSAPQDQRDDYIIRLIDIIGDTEDQETMMARDVVLNLYADIGDAEGDEDEISEAIYNAEDYVRDAIRKQGR